MIIRKAKRSDLEEVSDIYRRAYHERPYNERWKKRTALKNIREEFDSGIIYVAQNERQIAGFIAFSIYEWDDGKRTYVEDFAMLKEYRGMGVGKSLMKKVISDSRKARVKRIVLDVHKASKAFNLYKELGFKENGYVTMEKKL